MCSYCLSSMNIILIRLNYSIVVKHIPKAMNKVAHGLAHYALNMAVGHKLFLNPSPFATIAYQGDLHKLEDTEKRKLLKAAG